MKINIDADGVDHIRVARKAHTWLGRQIDIGAPNTFHLPQHEEFASILAYQLWLIHRNDMLRSVTYDDITNITIDTRRDINYIHGSVQRALRYMVDQNEMLYDVLVDEKLPFIYYEIVKGQPIEITHMQWYIQQIEDVRRIIQVGERLVV